jgi:hypothetical protein
MGVRRCRHAGRENGLHVLRGIVPTCSDWYWPNLHNALAGGGLPVRRFNAQQPHLA